VVTLTDTDRVEKIEFVKDTNFIINGGYFVFKKELFEYMKEGEELVCEPFERLIAENKLMGYRYDKFWHCMDTFKEQKELNEMYENRKAPWEIWKKN
jgi:glucose-1-phosphate cytidylyltransferase